MLDFYVIIASRGCGDRTIISN